MDGVEAVEALEMCEDVEPIEHTASGEDMDVELVEAASRPSCCSPQVRA